MVDSAFLWALVLEWLQAGAAMDTALAATIAAIEAGGGTGRFNFLVTDGTSIAATAWGDTLWYRRSAESVVVASEPGDDQPGWTEVPDRHSLTATPAAVSVRPLSRRDPRFHRDCPRPPRPPRPPHRPFRPPTARTTSATRGS